MVTLLLCSHVKNKLRDNQGNRGNHQESQEGTRAFAGTFIRKGRCLVSADPAIWKRRQYVERWERATCCQGAGYTCYIVFFMYWFRTRWWISTVSKPRRKNTAQILSGTWRRNRQTACNQGYTAICQKAIIPKLPNEAIPYCRLFHQDIGNRHRINQIILIFLSHKFIRGNTRTAVLKSFRRGRQWCCFFPEPETEEPDVRFWVLFTWYAGERCFKKLPWEH